MKTRKLVTLVLALVLVLVCGMQIAAVDHSHVWRKTGNTSQGYYTSEGPSTHSYTLWEELKCTSCGELSDLLTEGLTESHTDPVLLSVENYSGGTHRARYGCRKCGHIAYDKYLP